MKDSITLPLAIEIRECDIEKIAEFNERLNKVGVSIEYSEEKKKDLSLHFLSITCDPEIFDKKTKRGAGHKRKYMDRKVSVKEIRKRMENESAEKIAKDLGISRTTLFKKLKVAKEFDDEYLL